MSVETARQAKFRTATRVTQTVALAAVFTLLGSRGLHTAVANGDTRTISLHHTHRGDDITVTFKRNGRYDEDGLKKLNHFLRDWRTDDATTMDPQLFDAVWEVQREFGLDKPIHIISSYRSPRTNEMLRKRSSGVARHSLHMQGKAMDFFIPGVPLEKVREAAIRLQRGGVGFYPTSGSPFVHMDVGNVRMWPRMTREQLARVFPDGRTVHLPTDGKPLSGFALAQADLARRGSSGASFDADKKPNIFERMFAAAKPKPAEDEEDSEGATAKPQSKLAAAAARGRDNVLAALDNVKDKAAALPAAALVPVPKSRPAVPVQMASASPSPMPAQTAANAAPAARSEPPRPPAAIPNAPDAPTTPNDVIFARGYWQGPVETQADVSARARNIEVASADATASIGPFAAPPGYGEGKPRESLAYASAESTPDAPQRAKPVGLPIPRPVAVSANTTIAAKARPNAASEVLSAFPEELQKSNVREIQQRRLDGPFMRALMLTPSVERFMNTTLYGTPDFRALGALFQKPTEIVLMGFGVEPNAGLSHRSFGGRAIAFPATAQFTARATTGVR